MLKRIALLVIRGYQAGISPLMPAACRFTPSCSEYAYRAVERHGAGRGGWLALRRLLRCHPFGGRGYDPVPPADAPGSRTGAAPAREGVTAPPGEPSASNSRPCSR